MANVFDITTDQIKLLDDESARELVARLCRADLRNQGLPEPSVTWGGNQRAKDGGVDVRVDCPSPLNSIGYVLSPRAAFQVKAEKFIPSKIEGEMAPNGIMRPAIVELNELGGAYIIASTRDDVSDQALAARRTAMSDCLAKFGIGNSVRTDFYGCRQIADWVECYPSIASWLRHQIGQPLTGWRPYGPWAYGEDSIEAEYILDNRSKVFLPGAEYGCPAEEAIMSLRDELRKSVSIRLVGLSGVGKTRLVQALFDERVCSDGYIPPSDSVIYTDLMDQPSPLPVEFVQTLIADGGSSIVIIDNCGQELHSRLTEVIRKSPSDLKLLTIEYDIRDDLPEATKCYRLEGSSDDLIETLIRKRYETVSEADAARISSFSDGNSRVAFALASTVEIGGQISRLRDDDLFTRLFRQKNEVNDELLRVAEASSLVYSFDGDNLATEGEISILSAFTDSSELAFSRNLSELVRRGLLQKRSNWCAVLPHAIANRLAARLLDALPSSLFYDALVFKAPDRLSRSFTRRLGFLHDNKVAVGLADILLSPAGRLHDISQLSDFELDMFINIAPLNPQLVMFIYEKSVKDSSISSISIHARQKLCLLAKSLAYEAESFDRAVLILVSFAIIDTRDHGTKQSTDVLESLFYCNFSGTHAPVEQRIALTRMLLFASDKRLLELGLSIISCGLDTAGGRNLYLPDFGARLRDYGWAPKTQAELRHWYAAWLRLIEEVGLLSGERGNQARTILAEALRGLWGRVGLDDEIMATAERFRLVDGWPEGWLAARRIIQWDLKDHNKTEFRQLKALERSLFPSDLMSTIRARVLARGTFADDVEIVEPEGAELSSTERFAREAEALGKQAARAPEIVNQIIPDLMMNSGSGRSYHFGKGIGANYEKIRDLLDLVSDYVLDNKGINFSFIWVRGLISGWHSLSPESVGAFLDESIDHPVWGKQFVELQVQQPLDRRAFERISQSIEGGVCPTVQYNYLGMGRVTDTLSLIEKMELARKLLLRTDGGVTVSIDYLSMLVHGADLKDQYYVNSLGECVLEFLSELDWARFPSANGHVDYDINKLAEFAVNASDTENRVAHVIRAIIPDDDVAWTTNAVLRATALRPFFKKFPRLSLDLVCRQREDNGFSLARRLITGSYDERDRTHISLVPVDILIQWCDDLRTIRYPFAASTCSFLEKTPGDDPQYFVSDVAIAVLQNAPDKESVLSLFVRRLKPRSWSGSLAVILEKRLPMLRQLMADDISLLQAVKEHEDQLRKLIEIERANDRADQRTLITTFE